MVVCAAGNKLPGFAGRSSTAVGRDEVGVVTNGERFAEAAQPHNWVNVTTEAVAIRSLRIIVVQFFGAFDQKQ